MVNGSFTITNGGVFGSMMSTPIINGNQANYSWYALNHYPSNCN